MSGRRCSNIFRGRKVLSYVCINRVLLTWGCQHVWPWCCWFSDFWKVVEQTQYLDRIPVHYHPFSGLWGTFLVLVTLGFGLPHALCFMVEKCFYYSWQQQVSCYTGKCPGNGFFEYSGHPGLHVLLCLFHFLCNECCLVAHVLKVFSRTFLWFLLFIPVCYPWGQYF